MKQSKDKAGMTAGGKGVIIGVTGGVGAGKSTVLQMLQEEYQAVLLQADDIAKELMLPGGATYQALLQEFGSHILDSNGYIDRKRFADLIFMNEGANDRVNAIVHPLVADDMRKRALAVKRQAVVFQPVVLEAALLIEGGLADVCDRLWYVHASEEIRIQRLMETRGYSREKCLAIISCQLSEEAFLQEATDVVNSGGTVEDMRQQVRGLMQTLKAMIDIP